MALWKVKKKMSSDWQNLIRLLLQHTSILHFFLISVSFWKKTGRKNEKYQRQVIPDLLQWIILLLFGTLKIIVLIIQSSVFPFT